MKHRSSNPPRHGPASAAGVLIALTTLLGCAAQPPPDEFAPGLARLTGDAEGIRFEVDGAPVDATDGGPATTSLAAADAVRLALRNDPAVQVALARVRAALADARQARLLPNPILGVAVRFPEGGGDPGIDAALTADLLALLQKPRQVRAADRRLRAASSEALAAALDTIAAAGEQYAAARALDDQVRVLDEQLRILDQFLELIRQRFRAGEATQLDVQTLEAERVDLQIDVVQRASDRRQARLTLARLIGRPGGTIDWELPGATAAEEVVPAAPEADWVAAALANRPEVQAARWELAALGDEATLADLAGLEGAEAGADAERDGGEWAAGPALALPIPLLDWGQQRRAKAQAQRIEARHRLTQVRRQVVEDVRRAVDALMSSRAAVRTAESELIPLQRRRREQAERAYRAGMTNINAVLMAERNLQASRAKLIELRQQARTALVRLHRAAGGSAVVPAPRGVPTGTTRPTEQGGAP